MAHRSDYLLSVLDISRLPNTIASVVKRIKESGLTFDAIAFRGMSGALIAPAIALELKSELIMVRKSDDTHSTYTVEGFHNKGMTYIIVDDLVCSENTVRTIIKEIKQAYSDEKPKCKGVFCYYPTQGNYTINLEVEKNDSLLEKVVGAFVTPTIPVFGCYEDEHKSKNINQKTS